MKYAVLSDIHGNLSALESVIRDLDELNIKGVILLGDLINYGMRSNEVVEKIAELEQKYKISAKIFGNHEKAIMTQDYSRFSSPRGAQSAETTKQRLNKKTIEYINSLDAQGYAEFELDKLKCLAIHGSLDDPFWTSIEQNNLNGDYSKYDIVFSGHSHFPHYFTKNGKTYFLNPGSAGQPRNSNPSAQYAVFDSRTQEAELRAVSYDIELEQSYFEENCGIDNFYRDRLKKGL